MRDCETADWVEVARDAALGDINRLHDEELGVESFTGGGAQVYGPAVHELSGARGRR